MEFDVERIHILVGYFDTRFIGLGDKISLNSQTGLRLGVPDEV